MIDVETSCFLEPHTIQWVMGARDCEDGNPPMSDDPNYQDGWGAQYAIEAGLNEQHPQHIKGA